MRRFQYWALLLCLGGCVESPTEKSLPGYIDVDALLRLEQHRLHGRQVQLLKEVALGDSSETRQLVGDSLTLASELSVFGIINPAQPKYLNAFHVSKNGSETHYTNIDGSAELQRLTVRMEGEAVANITGVVSETTSIYTAFREMKLDFDGGQLSSYSVNGYQKMIFSDTVFFNVRTELIVPK